MDDVFSAILKCSNDDIKRLGNTRGWWNAIPKCSFGQALRELRAEYDEKGRRRKASVNIPLLGILNWIIEGVL